MRPLTHRVAFRAAILAATAFSTARFAEAEFWIGNGVTANWTTASNWSATQGGATNNTLPPQGDFAYFNMADATSRTITFDYSPAFTPSYGQIQLNQTGAGNLTLQLLATTTFTTGNFYLGTSGHGTYSQNASSITITNVLTLGANVSGSGTFVLAGGTVNAGGASINVGAPGNGTFNHNAGSVNAATLNIGSSGSAVGLYTLGNQFASLSVTGYETIGGGTSGTFNQTNAVNYCGGISLNAGGVYNLSNGTINSGYNSVSSDDFVGEVGSATFNQTGGTHTVGQASPGRTLYIGNDGGTGVYFKGEVC